MQLVHAMAGARPHGMRELSSGGPRVSTLPARAHRGDDNACLSAAAGDALQVRTHITV